jgi:hypothetical protein
MKAKLANFRMAIAAAKGPNVGAQSIFHYFRFESCAHGQIIVERSSGIYGGLPRWLCCLALTVSLALRLTHNRRADYALRASPDAMAAG